MNIKPYWLSVLYILFLFAFVPAARASEGRFSLRSDFVVCEGISVWQNGGYHITGRCDGLVYPYAEQFAQYVLWVKPEDEKIPFVKVDTIENGVFDGRLSKKFTGLLITAEQQIASKNPAGIVIISGNVDGFDFPERTTSGRGTDAQNFPSPIITATPTPTPSTKPPGIAGLSRLSPILIIVVVIIVIIALFSLFSRR